MKALDTGFAFFVLEQKAPVWVNKKLNGRQDVIFELIKIKIQDPIFLFSRIS